MEKLEFKGLLERGKTLKILFLPFMKMPTGHHTVADALIRSLEGRISNLVCKKIDFFSYADKLLEKAFRLTYLTWIDHSPQTFVWLYRNFVYPSKATKHFKWYESKFLDKMEALLEEEKADLIVCTQAFPSFLVSRLRCAGVRTPPVINVYTDYFVNKLWGINGIDYHFVPDNTVKTYLINHQVNPANIFVTGIPIDECFDRRPAGQPSPPYHILIAGGSEGLGGIQHLVASLPASKDYHFSLLCGHNKKLYNEVLSLRRDNIKPLPYLSSRTGMNTLYNQSDAIISKAGGVTMSEALFKRLPIFIHSSLPGQEEINRQFLREKGLVFSLNQDYSIQEQLDEYFNNIEEQHRWTERVAAFFDQIEVKAWQKIIELTVRESIIPFNLQDSSNNKDNKQKKVNSQ